MCKFLNRTKPQYYSEPIQLIVLVNCDTLQTTSGMSPAFNVYGCNLIGSFLISE